MRPRAGRRAGPDPGHCRGRRPTGGECRTIHDDEDDNRIEWGAEGPNRYHGWLQVTGDGSHAEVTVHISSDRVAEAGDIEDGLQRTLGEIRRLVEAGVAAG